MDLCAASANADAKTDDVTVLTVYADLCKCSKADTMAAVAGGSWQRGDTPTAPITCDSKLQIMHVTTTSIISAVDSRSITHTGTACSHRHKNGIILLCHGQVACKAALLHNQLQHIV